MMENENLKTKIMQAIESGQVTMRPRWHFLLKTALMFLGVLLAAFSLLYIASFVIFAMAESGLLYVPAFGLAGVYEFLRSAPWVMVFLALLLGLVVYELVKNYSFSYHRPLALTVLGVVLFALAGGFLVTLTPLHNMLFERSLTSRPLNFAGIYDNYVLSASDKVLEGTILETAENGYLVENLSGDEVFVKINPETILPNMKEIRENDLVLVFGEKSEEFENETERSFEAKGIRFLPQHRPMRKVPGLKKQKMEKVQREEINF